MNVDSSNNEKEKEIKITENTKITEAGATSATSEKKRIYYIK